MSFVSHCHIYLVHLFVLFFSVRFSSACLIHVAEPCLSSSLEVWGLLREIRTLSYVCLVCGHLACDCFLFFPFPFSIQIPAPVSLSPTNHDIQSDTLLGWRSEWKNERIWRTLTRARLWWLDYWVRAAQNCNSFSLSAVVSIYQKEGTKSKEGTVLNRRQGHMQPRLIDAQGSKLA